jgi:hypothetical protein
MQVSCPAIRRHIPTVSVLMVARALEVMVWSLTYSIVDAAPADAISLILRSSTTQRACHAASSAVIGRRHRRINKNTPMCSARRGRSDRRLLFAERDPHVGVDLRLALHELIAGF